MLNMAQKRLTDRIVKSLPAPDHGNQIVYDLDVKGFGARITASGGRAFVLNYRRKSDGRERRWTIGAFPDWGTGAARDEARRLKRLIDGGADPVGEHQGDRAAPSVADLCARFEAEYLPRKRAWTQKGYRQQIATDILPALRRIKVAAVTYADVDRLHRAISERAPTHANRVIALLSKLMTLAIKWQMRSDNPVKGVERNQEQKRRRYLSSDELVRLTVALAGHRDQQAANILRLLLLTGARRGEVLAAEWNQFDLEAGIWTKPGATTKQRTDHVVPLSAPVRQLLADLHQTRGDSEYLFPGRLGGHRLDVKDAWASIRKAADITGLRVHDLRHSFASSLAGAGYGLHIIGALLGHTQPATTHRYAHLTDDPLRAATERAGAILSGQPSAEIVSFKGGKSA
jgi:integrase